jgi:hypothetical protein
MPLENFYVPSKEKKRTICASFYPQSSKERNNVANKNVYTPQLIHQIMFLVTPLVAFGPYFQRCLIN